MDDLLITFNADTARYRAEGIADGGVMRTITDTTRQGVIERWHSAAANEWREPGRLPPSPNRAWQRRGAGQ